MSPSPELDQNLNLEAVVFSIVKLFQFRVCAEQCSGLGWQPATRQWLRSLVFPAGRDVKARIQLPQLLS